MATVTLTYVEDEDDGLTHMQTVTITRNNVEDIYELLNFLSEGIRSIGQTQYERVGVSTKQGQMTWSSM
tara:strand:- start:241 stop:447 length:207 start_codon:yes stop_codon:yes gene_type:complete